MNKTKWNETITTRYDRDHSKVWKNVMDLVDKHNLTKSGAQLLLVERGLAHTQNPEPLIKEKIIYKDKIVYKDAPKVDVSKDTQKETPKEHIQIEHLTDTPKKREIEHLTDAPKVDVLKDTQKETPLSVNKDGLAPTVSESIGWWIAGIIATTLVGWKIAKAKGWI